MVTNKKYKEVYEARESAVESYTFERTRNELLRKQYEIAKEFEKGAMAEHEKYITLTNRIKQLGMSGRLTTNQVRECFGWEDVEFLGTKMICLLDSSLVHVLKWTGKNHREMFDFLTDCQYRDQFMVATGEKFDIDHSKVFGGLIIKVDTGSPIPVNIGDYVIRAADGGFVPCEKTILNCFFKKVEDLRKAGE